MDVISRAVLLGAVFGLALTARAEDVAAVGSYVARAPTDLVLGTFSVPGGAIVVKPAPEGRLELSGTLHGRRVSGTSQTPPPNAQGKIEGRWFFDLGSEHGISIRALAGGRLLADDGAGAVALERRRNALVVCGPRDPSDKDGPTFLSVATEVATYLSSKGYSTEIVHVDWTRLRAKLLEAEAAGTPYDRVVFACHCGWDGPILSDDPSVAQFSGQTYPNGWSMAGPHSEWERFVDAVRRGTTSDARIYAPECHAGGSDRSERQGKNSTYIWSDDLAKKTGRTVAGPEGRFSCFDDALRLVRALEGENVKVPTETRISTASGGRTIEPEPTPGLRGFLELVDDLTDAAKRRWER
jgi:hypothetical protein